MRDKDKEDQAWREILKKYLDSYLKEGATFFQVAQNSFQHLDIDGLLDTRFITWCYDHGIKSYLRCP